MKLRVETPKGELKFEIADFIMKGLWESGNRTFEQDAFEREWSRIGAQVAKTYDSRRAPL